MKSHKKHYIIYYLSHFTLSAWSCASKSESGGVSTWWVYMYLVCWWLVMDPKVGPDGETGWRCGFYYLVLTRINIRSKRYWDIGCHRLSSLVYELKGDQNPAGRRTGCSSARDNGVVIHTCLRLELSGETPERVIRPIRNYYPVEYRSTYVAGHRTISG